MTLLMGGNYEQRRDIVDAINMKSGDGNMRGKRGKQAASICPVITRGDTVPAGAGGRIGECGIAVKGTTDYSTTTRQRREKDKIILLREYRGVIFYIIILYSS